MENKIAMLNEAKKAIEQLNEITRIALLYNQGAPADACMERIKKVILE
jgi:hypothetical protein